MVKIFLGCLVLQILMMSCSTKRNEKPLPVKSAVNEYPDLTLTFEKGDQIATKEMQGNNVFILFQPGCDHCQEEAKEIEQSLDGFKDYTLYFISSSPIPQIMKFAEDYKLDNKHNVKFAYTSTDGVLNQYGPIQTPSVYIYSQGKLLKSFNGQTNIENILRSL